MLMSLSNCPTSQSLLFYVQYFSVILKPATLPIYTWHQFFFNLRIELNLNNNIFYKKWFCQWKKIKLTFRNNTALICVKSLFRTGLTEVVVYVWEPCLGNNMTSRDNAVLVDTLFLCVWMLTELYITVMAPDVTPEMTAVVSKATHCLRTWSLWPARKHEGPERQQQRQNHHLGRNF